MNYTAPWAPGLRPYALARKVYQNLYSRLPYSGTRGSVYGIQPRPQRRRRTYGRGRKPVFRGEMKTKDTAISLDLAGITFLATDSLCLTLQGVSHTQRIGDVITLRKLKMRLRVVRPAQGTGPEASGRIRIMVILDKQANGITPTAGTWQTKVLDGPSVDSFRNVHHTTQYKVLSSQVLVFEPYGPIDPAGITEFPEMVKYFEWYKDVNIPIRMTSSAAADASVASNNIFVGVIAPSTLDVTVSGEFRVTFSDTQ